MSRILPHIRSMTIYIKMFTDYCSPRLKLLIGIYMKGL